MDPRQRHREKAKKKRNKVRRAHLEEASRRRTQQAIDQVLSSPEISEHMPDKDDRLGWARHNAIGPKNILRTAMRMFPDSPVLKKYFSHDLRGDDEWELGLLLTRVSRTLACDPPYFVPYVEAKKNGEILVHVLELAKRTTPFGAMWSFDKYLKEKTAVHLNGQVLPLWLSSHAVDRLWERMEGSKEDAGMAFTLFNRLRIGDPLVRSGNALLPVSLEFEKPLENCHFGYFPVEAQEGMAIAKTFVLLGMDGTPEADQIRNACGGRMELNSVSDLIRKEGILEKAGINPFQVAHVEGASCQASE